MGSIKMNVITLTTLRNHLGDALKEVREKKDYLLVLKKGRPISALVNLDFFEDLLALTSKKYLNSIKKARAEYQKKQIFNHEEAFGGNIS